MSIELMMPSNHLILCRPRLPLPSIFPSIRVFSSDSALRIRWPRTGASASASVLPVDIQGWFPLGGTGLNPSTLRASSTACVSSWFCFPGELRTRLEQRVPSGEGCFCLSLLSGSQGPLRALAILEAAVCHGTTEAYAGSTSRLAWPAARVQGRTCGCPEPCVK